MPEVYPQRREATLAPAPEKAPAAEANQDGLKRSLQGRSFEDQTRALAPGGDVERERTPGLDHPTTGHAQPAAPAPTGDTVGGALVLSRDPRYVGNGFVGWFSQQVQAKATLWGVPAASATVRVAKDASGTGVMVLDWPSAWGAAPVSKEVPDLHLRPIEARFAVLGAQALPGWAKLNAADQATVTALLSGETNALSSNARLYLAPKIASLKAAPEESQASLLSGMIGHRDATPSLVAEPVATSPANVTLSAPTVQQDYDFRGGKADADIYVATFDDGTSLEIIAPKSPDPTYHQYTVEQAADAARYIPTKNRATVRQILLNTVRNPDDAYWAVKYNTPNFRSFMTAGQAGVVTIYPNADGPQPSIQTMRGSLIHETGHSWSYQQWGMDKTKGKWVDWKACMDSDRVSVSEYAMNDIAEDVAETVQVYGSSKGTPMYQEYQAMIPARLKMLEKELG